MGKIKKSFAKKDLQECASEESEKLESIEQEITGSRRWSIAYKMVFKDVETGKFYQTFFSRGATENQDEVPFEYDGDPIACSEVELKEVTVKQFVEVTSGEE